MAWIRGRRHPSPLPNGFSQFTDSNMSFPVCLEIDMRPNGADPGRTAIAVIAGVVDMLHIQRIKQPAPGMPVVIALDDILAPIIQVAVAQQKPQSAELQVLLMVAFNGV